MRFLNHDVESRILAFSCIVCCEWDNFIHWGLFWIVMDDGRNFACAIALFALEYLVA